MAQQEGVKMWVIKNDEDNSVLAETGSLEFALKYLKNNQNRFPFMNIHHSSDIEKTKMAQKLAHSGEA